MRRAIVTGGESGLGAACTSRLRADGVEVFTFDVSPDADLSVDVTDAAAVEAAVAEIGQVDILINSAGIVGPGPVHRVVDVERADDSIAPLFLRYDRSDPTSIVTDDSHTGRNITLWIVAIKLVIGGAVLSWFGFRRLRRA